MPALVVPYLSDFFLPREVSTMNLGILMFVFPAQYIRLANGLGCDVVRIHCLYSFV